MKQFFKIFRTVAEFLANFPIFANIKRCNLSFFVFYKILQILPTYDYYTIITFVFIELSVWAEMYNMITGIYRFWILFKFKFKIIGLVDGCYFIFANF